MINISAKSKMLNGKFNYKTVIKGRQIEVQDVPLNIGLSLIEIIKFGDLDQIRAYSEDIENMEVVNHNQQTLHTYAYCINNYIVSTYETVSIPYNKQQNTITLQWLYISLCHLAAMNNNKEILHYLFQTTKFRTFSVAYQNYIILNALDVALEFGNKETAAFLLESGARPFYKDPLLAKWRDIFGGEEPYSYFYKIILYNILNKENNLKYYAEHYSGLPAEIINHIWSYKDKYALENTELMVSCRDEIFEERKNSAIICGSIILATSLGLWLGTSLTSPLITTILCARAGLMYYVYNIEHKKNALVFSEAVNFALLSYFLGGMDSVVTNLISMVAVERFRSLGAELNSNLKLAGTALAGIVTFAVTNYAFNYEYSYLSCIGSLFLIYGTGTGMSNILNASEGHGLKPWLNYGISLIRSEVEIFADVSYKTCLHAKDYAMKSIDKFTDRVLKSSNNSQHGMVGEGMAH
ncbi:ankyrin repeat domain-containing protein [Candidatus Jidaibacter acanthamoebae]|nr:ankyrin repeat domain-containing protein [Candidatus Jidaibacter acanthamoeba]